MEASKIKLLCKDCYWVEQCEEDEVCEHFDPIEDKQNTCDDMMFYKNAIIESGKTYCTLIKEMNNSKKSQDYVEILRAVDKDNN